MIQIRELEFMYKEGGFSLQVPELGIPRGTKTALIGPSGAGKTTLLHLIAGILVPLRGTVVTNDERVSSLPDTTRRDFRIQQVGLVFQEFELLEHLTVADNILLPCRISPALHVNSELRARTERLAAAVGIQDKLRRPVGQLSQGERQRVAICRALLAKPPLLLCDEPTGNLDMANKEHILDILVDYVEKTDATLVTVTHDHDILPRFDQVIDFKQFHQASEKRS